jgi:integrase
MANTKVRLVKRVKLTDSYNQDHQKKFALVSTPEEFAAFQAEIAKTPWRFCPVVKDPKGRYMLSRVQLPGYAFTSGAVPPFEAEVPRRSGSYHLDYREAGTRLRPTVLTVLSEAGRVGISLDNLSPKDITDAIGIVERRLDGIKHGDIKVESKLPKKREAKKPLPELINVWLDDRTPGPQNKSGERTLAENTLISYRGVLNGFGDFIAKTRKRQHVDDITAADLKAYYGHLATIPNRVAANGFGLSAASRNISLTVVSTFLRTSGKGDILESWSGLRKTPTVKRATNEETNIDDYTDEQISAMFAVATQEERELFEFFLGTGFRAGEVAVAEWTDLVPKEGIIKVRKKTVMTALDTAHGKKAGTDWVPKYRRNREVPISQALIARLAARKKRVPPSNLIFPVAVVFPNGAYLRAMKSLGHRTGLACGQCHGCEVRERTKKSGCDEFYLHRWRHTFACRHLRGNPDGSGKFDVKTVSTWLGHKSIEITERYLHAARGSEVQEKLNVGPLSRSY